MKKAIHYINQFFAGVGGEDKAHFEPELREGKVGPGLALDSVLDAEITHTVICGDNFMGEKTDEAVSRIIDMLKPLEFDIFLAGPAFQAGRYGVACGTIAKAVQEEFGVPVVSSMHIENPGVEMFRKDLYILKGGASAAQTKKDTAAMANVANKLLQGEAVGTAEAEGYFPRGIREQVFLEEPVSAARRGVDMLIKKLAGEPFETELPIPAKDMVDIAPPIKDLSKARIAIVNTGGIVPVDNPDRIQSASATRWGRYDISEMDRLQSGEYKTIHAGFDPAAADADPNVIVPLDVMKEMEKEGVYGSLHPYFYSTVGTGTTQAEAERMGKEMLEKLQEDEVDGVILVSTWGTCTRCGATIVKTIERSGMPIVQMANLVPVAMTVGSNKIVPTISIPYPLGDPATPKDEQHKLRYNRVKAALEALTADVKEQTVFPVK